MSQSASYQAAGVVRLSMHELTAGTSPLSQSPGFLITSAPDVLTIHPLISF